MAEDLLVGYWDSSAVLSALFEDEHTPKAVSWIKTSGLHLITTLVYAEVCAVIGRMEKSKAINKSVARMAVDMVNIEPWRRTTIQPGWPTIKRLAINRGLRGADLWHLAAAMELKVDFPELVMLSFDIRLNAAARREGLALLA
jgi:predicted nucleic acid-binding protein